jgi:hypothetical protein
MSYTKLNAKAVIAYRELGGIKSKPARIIRAQMEEIDRLREYIAREGEITETCTFNPLGTICNNCHCIRKLTKQP